MTAAARALILDFDGVVGPVHGRTAWGDDVLAGDSFGAVYTSPAMTDALDKLAMAPDLSCWWLTSWTPGMRTRLHPCPGRNWPTIPSPVATRAERSWWKLRALSAWLAQRPEIRSLAWCDDHLAESARAAAVGRRLTRFGVEFLLLAPRTSVGLTPQHLNLLSGWVRQAPAR